MRIIVSLVIALLCFTANAQEDKRIFSMEEAIAFALETNRSAINAERSVEAAKKQKWEAIATGLPQVDLTGEYQNFLKRPVTPFPSEFFGGTPGNFTPLETVPQHGVTATATATQLIFDGSYIVGLQSSKVFLEISKNAKEKTDLEVRKAVINAYGNVLVAEESVKILGKNKSNLEKNLEDTEKVYNNGLAEQESVEQLQITLSTVENSYNNAIRLRNIAYKLFNITLGINVNAQVQLTDDLEDLTIENTQPDLATTPFLIENNVDYKIAKNSQRAQELLLKLEKTKALPSLVGYVSAGYQGFGVNNDFTFLYIDQPWFGNALLGVRMTVPVFSSLKRHARTQRARIELDKATTELTETEQKLKLQLETSRSDYQFAIEQYNTSKKNLELAERIEAKNQVKYKEGISSSFDLRQAQTQLYTIQQEYLQAMLQVITNKAELEAILNSKN